MSKFRKKPVVIDAVQIREGWFGGEPHPIDDLPSHVRVNPMEKTVQVDTLEGTMTACAGDWIITGVEGEQYPCKDSVFRATYEPVAVDMLRSPAMRRLLKVKAGGRLYDSSKEPIMLMLSDQDKKLISEMDQHSHKYACAPEHFSKEQMAQFMELSGTGVVE